MTDAQRMHADQFIIANTPYAGFFVQPRDGMDPETAITLHLTDWRRVMEQSRLDHRYLFYRMSNLKWDRLTRDFFEVSGVQFPVYFKVTEEEFISPQRNFEKMLITTRFPCMPANECDNVYTFDPVEDVYDLRHFTRDALRTPGVCDHPSDVTHSVLERGTVLAMREKHDGMLLVRMRCFGIYYLVGRFWLDSDGSIDSVEASFSSLTLEILSPFIKEEMCIGEWRCPLNCPVPAKASLAMAYKEGAILFVLSDGEMKECRIKRCPTAEVEIRSGKVLISPSSPVTCSSMPVSKVPDGVYEVSLDNGSFSILRYRPMKTPIRDLRCLKALRMKDYFDLKRPVFEVKSGFSSVGWVFTPLSNPPTVVYPTSWLSTRDFLLQGDFIYYKWEGIRYSSAHYFLSGRNAVIRHGVPDIGSGPTDLPLFLRCRSQFVLVGGTLPSVKFSSDIRDIESSVKKDYDVHSVSLVKIGIHVGILAESEDIRKVHTVDMRTASACLDPCPSSLLLEKWEFPSSTPKSSMPIVRSFSPLSVPVTEVVSAEVRSLSVPPDKDTHRAFKKNMIRTNKKKKKVSVKQ